MAKKSPAKTGKGAAPAKRQPARSALADNIDRLMRDKGLSIRQLARDSDTDPGNLSRLLAGKLRSLKTDTLPKIAGGLGVTVAELMGEAAPPSAPEGSWGGAIHHDYVAFAALVPSPDNPRKTFDDGTIAELADSIAQNGILQNLVVRVLPEDRRPWIAARYEIVAGGRRYRALQRLVADGRWDEDAKTIPVRIVGGDEASVRAIALLENLQREEVPPLEEGAAFVALRELDPKVWTTATIAERIRKTPRYVQQRMALPTKLIPAAQKALAEGRLDLARARVLATAPAAQQKAALRNTLDGTYSWSTAEDLRQRLRQDWTPVSAGAFDPAASGLEIVEDAETGDRFFADRIAFLAKQKEEAQARVAALAADWAWAELYDGHFSWVSDDYAEERSDDRTQAGCLVCLRRDGTLEIVEGLVRLPEIGGWAERDDDDEDEEETVAAAAARQARAEAEREFDAALRSAVADRTEAGLRLLALFALAGANAPCELNFGETDEIGRRRRFADRLGDLAWPESEFEDTEDWDRGAVLKGAADLSESWAALARLDPAVLQSILAATAADLLFPILPGYASGIAVRRRFVATLADELGIEVPVHLRPEDPADTDASPAAQAAE